LLPVSWLNHLVEEGTNMRGDRQAAVFLLLFLTIVTGDATTARQTSAKPDQEPITGRQSVATSKAKEIGRGKYLVEEVARCPECHTPRNSNGALDRSKWLQGGPIWIRPVQPNGAWAERAPALAGFPYTDHQAENILERGIGTNGNSIQPPMFSYHLHHADAMAIVAYLRSLPPGT
jgi:mono/diheme cytochrome c family protein